MFPVLVEYKLVSLYYSHFIYIYNKNLPKYDTINTRHKPTARTSFYPVQSLSTNKAEVPAKVQIRRLCSQ